MAGPTSAICNSWKTESMSAGHCFVQPSTFTGTMASASQTVTSVSSTANLALGMPVTATNLTAGAVVESFVSSTSITLSRAATATITAGTFTPVGDIFKLALIKFGATGTYGAATVNYTDVTGNSDEVSGTGYTAGGVALTNVSPALATNTAWTTFNNSPATSWTTATIDSAGCLIYNTTTRIGGTSGTNTTGTNRAVAVFAFTGEEKVTAGTFTITYPATANGLLSVT